VPRGVESHLVPVRPVALRHALSGVLPFTLMIYRNFCPELIDNDGHYCLSVPQLSREKAQNYREPLHVGSTKERSPTLDTSGRPCYTRGEERSL